MEPMTLTVEEVAALLRLSVITVYRELVKRRLPGFKVGNQWRVRRDILQEWMEEKSGWTRRFDRLWSSFQRQGRRRRVTERAVAAEVRAARRGER
ncbi:MAG: helix-turn-helix domain-containing protein [Elusimicrobia bacterium]|nr:helix-turn-helix domain-containing protein [Elusimicrobiota bacterium]